MHYIQKGKHVDYAHIKVREIILFVLENKYSLQVFWHHLKDDGTAINLFINDEDLTKWKNKYEVTFFECYY